MHKDILENGEIIAQFYDLNEVSEVNFPTPISSEFQFGYALLKEKKEFNAHLHKRVKRDIENTSEFLYVVDGEMKIEIFSNDKVLVETLILKSNMGVLQFYGGHKIIASANTKYFEIKQGPYLGKEHDKQEF